MRGETCNQSNVLCRNTALLIVDLQQGFVNDATRHVVPQIRQMVPQYAHVIATRFFNQMESNYRRLLHWNRFDRQSKDFPLAIDLPGALIVDKPTYSCVTPEFLDTLQQWGISEVHLCGIDTDICVMKCAVDLFENNFRPVVFGAACASTAGRAYHEAALKILIRYIGAEQVRVA